MVYYTDKIKVIMDTHAPVAYLIETLQSLDANLKLALHFIPAKYQTEKRLLTTFSMLANTFLMLINKAPTPVSEAENLHSPSGSL